MFIGSNTFELTWSKDPPKGCKQSAKNIYKQYDSQPRTKHVVVYCVHIYVERERERSFSFATSSTKTPVFCGQQNYVFFWGIEFHGPKKNSLSQSRPCRIQPRFAHVVRPLDRRSQKEQKKQAPVQLPSRRGFKFQASQSKSVVKLRKREADILTLKTCLS